MIDDDIVIIIIIIRSAPASEMSTRIRHSTKINRHELASRDIRQKWAIRIWVTHDVSANSLKIKRIDKNTM